MRAILIPIICLLLGLAGGYMVTSATTDTRVTPAMIEEGLRENPRLVLDLLQQYPVEVFDVVVKGQELKRKEARDEQIMAQLLDPAEVAYSEDRIVRGNKNAPITIVEFSDFQCPHCSKASEVVTQIIEENPDKVNQVFLHMPLGSHQMAPLAAAYFEAAAMQDPDKAWEFHDLLFANQAKIKEQGAEFLREAAEKAGLDLEQIDEALKSTEIRDRLQADAEAAKKLGLRGTPSYVIGGVVVSGALPKEDFEEVIALIEEHGSETPAPEPQPEAESAQPAPQPEAESAQPAQ